MKDTKYKEEIINDIKYKLFYKNTRETQEQENEQVILISRPRCLPRFIQGSIYRVLGVKETNNRWDTRIKKGVCKLMLQKSKSHVTNFIYNTVAMI